MATRAEWAVNGLVIGVPVLVLVGIIVGGSTSGFVIVPVFLAFLGGAGVLIGIGAAVCRSRVATRWGSAGRR